ncbi:hypothetical protein [Vibrio diazotrophicus]|uniref:hypothetical protein n=1 Tax=Vibrio diazotrophicus TaxID=685 RepID=UPI000C9E3C3E|nr:hypothetical protein [Vibrio diazotrophicus]PNH93084.1 hypothetical protein C1M59_07685 [Vibrio diazotrophicus]
MIWMIVLLVTAIAFVFIKRSSQKSKLVVWEGSCPPTTFSYRDQNGRQRVTVKPIRLITKEAQHNLIAVDVNGNEKIFFSQLIDSMLVTEGHKKKHFDDWINDVLFNKTQ